MPQWIHFLDCKTELGRRTALERSTNLRHSEIHRTYRFAKLLDRHRVVGRVARFASCPPGGIKPVPKCRMAKGQSYAPRQNQERITRR
jgi:hypothetical protein